MAPRRRRHSFLRHRGVAFFGVALISALLFLAAAVWLLQYAYRDLGWARGYCFSILALFIGLIGCLVAATKGYDEGERYGYTFVGAVLLGLIIAMVMAGLLMGALA
jgi:Ca2+/Na+ antiporter